MAAPRVSPRVRLHERGARAAARELGAKVRRASPAPRSLAAPPVWQGSADTIIVPGNADAIVLQWTDLHGVAPRPDREDEVAGHPRRTWLGKDGSPLIEEYMITGMAHGIPLDPGSGEGESGEAGAHMLDVGLSSTDRIAASSESGRRWRRKRRRPSLAPPTTGGRRAPRRNRRRRKASRR